MCGNRYRACEPSRMRRRPRAAPAATDDAEGLRASSAVRRKGPSSAGSWNSRLRWLSGAPSGPWTLARPGMPQGVAPKSSAAQRHIVPMRLAPPPNPPPGRRAPARREERSTTSGSRRAFRGGMSSSAPLEGQERHRATAMPPLKEQRVVRGPLMSETPLIEARASMLPPAQQRALPRTVQRVR